MKTDLQIYFDAYSIESLVGNRSSKYRLVLAAEICQYEFASVAFGKWSNGGWLFRAVK
jgi:hypothetical protein